MFGLDPNLFGEPGKKFHSTRIFGLALYDILGTIALAWIFTYLTEIPLWKSLVGMFVVGEILHYIFGTPTAFIKMIGLA
jgi:hypothetical protein